MKDRSPASFPANVSLLPPAPVATGERLAYSSYLVLGVCMSVSEALDLSLAIATRRANCAFAYGADDDARASFSLKRDQDVWGSPRVQWARHHSAIRVAFSRSV